MYAPHESFPPASMSFYSYILLKSLVQLFVSFGCNMLSLIIVAISAKIDIEHDSTFCMDRRSSVQCSLIRSVKQSSVVACHLRTFGTESGNLGTGGTTRNLSFTTAVQCNDIFYRIVKHSFNVGLRSRFTAGNRHQASS
jgi:hypothetical protein